MPAPDLAASGPAAGPLQPGRAALAVGRVVHHRRQPAEHRFVYPMTQIWIDPDDPGALFDQHRLWSHRGRSPVRFRRRDYLDGSDRPLGDQVRARLADALDQPVTGPLRMLTQPRVWGWLFNPLTIYLAWSPDRIDLGPSAALLEVTNTPWKERLCYPLALVPDPTGNGLEARFDKALHVSPFLDQRHTYHLQVSGRQATGVDVRLDVHPHHDPVEPVLTTSLTARLLGADRPEARRAMTEVLSLRRLPTHRVSFGIHRQALGLWRKGVRFVPHPARRS